MAGALCAGGLVESGGAWAAIPAGNLVQNPGGEASAGSTDSSTSPPPPSWTITGEFSVVQYGATGGFPTTDTGSSINGGANFFAGGSTTPSTGEQVIDVSAAAPEIDANGASARLSADLGGYFDQDDNATVTATFLNDIGPVGSMQIGPVTRADRAGAADPTTLLPREATAAIPAGTRSIRVTITSTSTQGPYNDGYADNVSLTLLAGQPGPPPPTVGKTANAEPDSGVVRVKLPGSDKFVSLSEAKQLPVGTEFDATNGVVRLSTAKSGSGGTAGVGTFSEGRFVLGQTKKNPLTTLSMKGGGLGGCKTKLPKGGAAKPGARAAAKRRRSLFSSVKGHFRTRGRNSSATVRGTKWRMVDTCSGTRTTVKQGSVTVHDFGLRKNKVVTAGHSYFARAAKKKRKRGIG